MVMINPWSMRSVLLGVLLSQVPAALVMASEEPVVTDAVETVETVDQWLLYVNENGVWLAVLLLSVLGLYGLRRRKKAVRLRQVAKQAAQHPRRRRAAQSQDQASQLSTHEQPTTAERSPEAEQSPEAGQIAALPAIKADASRLPATAPLLGRQAVLDQLDKDLAAPHVAVVSLVAAAGMGKTALLDRWTQPVEGNEKLQLFFWIFHPQERASTPSGSELFFQQALAFFTASGPWPTTTSQQAEVLLQRLQHLAGKQRIIMVLDGLESVQNREGCLVDHGLSRFLSAMATPVAQRAWNNLLLVLTARQPIGELAAVQGGGHRSVLLGKLPDKTSTQLFHELGIKGKFADFRSLVKMLHGHPLLVSLAGRMISKYYEGKMANKPQFAGIFTPEEAASATPKEVELSSAFWFGDLPGAVLAMINRTLRHYDTVLWSAGQHGRLLRFLGVLEQPLADSALQSLLQDVPWMQPLRSVLPDGLDAIFTDMQQAGLLQHSGESQGENHGGRVWSLHPLVAHTFGQALQQENLQDWRQAHHHLARYYEKLGREKSQEVSAATQGLESLHHAVRHACLAGEYRFALKDIYQKRIVSGVASTAAHGGGVSVSGDEINHRSQTNLALLAAFFPDGWHRLPETTELTAEDRYWLFQEAAITLTTLAQAGEAVGPRRAEMQVLVQEEKWQKATVAATQLCDLLLLSGELQEARLVVEQGLSWAKKAGDPFWNMVLQTLLAHMQHQSGELESSLQTFQAAEELEKARQSGSSRLLGLQGRYYCDLLLERAQSATELQAILVRVEEFMQFRIPGDPLQEVAQDHLLYGRILLVLGRDQEAQKAMDQALAVAQQVDVPVVLVMVLLSRALLLRQLGELQAAQQVVAEALLTSVRCGLLLCEVEGRLLEGHLLLDDHKMEEAEQSLKRAETLMNRHAYGRCAVKIWVLQARLLRQQGRQDEGETYRVQAKERIEERGQWGLLPLWEQEW